MRGKLKVADEIRKLKPNFKYRPTAGMLWVDTGSLLSRY
jgi:hypothetical protein